jgi:predicted transcriptional regulator
MNEGRDKLSIYIPQDKQRHRLVERLIELAEKRDRSVNYLVVQAILEYLDREEKREE